MICGPGGVGLLNLLIALTNASSKFCDSPFRSEQIEPLCLGGKENSEVSVVLLSPDVAGVATFILLTVLKGYIINITIKWAHIHHNKLRAALEVKSFVHIFATLN